MQFCFQQNFENKLKMHQYFLGFKTPIEI